MGQRIQMEPGRSLMTHPWRQWALGWLGLAALLGTLVFYAASDLLAPGRAVAVLLIIWLALLVASIWLLRTRRRRSRPGSSGSAR